MRQSSHYSRVANTNIANCVKLIIMTNTSGKGATQHKIQAKVNSTAFLWAVFLSTPEKNNIVVGPERNARQNSPIVVCSPNLFDDTAVLCIREERLPAHLGRFASPVD